MTPNTPDLRDTRLARDWARRAGLGEERSSFVEVSSIRGGNPREGQDENAKTTSRCEKVDNLGRALLCKVGLVFACEVVHQEGPTDARRFLSRLCMALAASDTSSISFLCVTPAAHAFMLDTERTIVPRACFPRHVSMCLSARVTVV